LSGVVVATDAAFSDLGPGRWRVESFVRALAARGGGTLVCPGIPDAPLPEGVVQCTVAMAPGLAAERRVGALSGALSALLETTNPALVHVDALEAASPVALARPRSGRSPALILEPGVLPSQALRDRTPQLAPGRLEDLVALEDKILARSAQVVAHAFAETATLMKRGVDPARVCVVPPPSPLLGTLEPPPALANLVAWVDGEPWCAWPVLLDALARVRRPWRTTLLVGPGAPVAAIEQHARWAQIAQRLTLVRDLSAESLAARLQGAHLVVSALKETRAVQAGALVPPAALLACAARRRLVAPALAPLHAHAGPALVAPAGGGHDAESLSRIIEDALDAPEASLWTPEAERFAAANDDQARTRALISLWRGHLAEDG